MQNLKNAIKENEIFTERRIDPKANLKISKLNYEESEFDIYQNMAMKVSQSDTKISNQFNAMTVQSDLIQKEKQTKQLNSNNTNTQIINSKNEIRLEQNSRHSEVDSLIKTSEMCFNSVLNKMNDDLNPRVLQKIPNNELNLGKIRKNKESSVHIQPSIDINLEEKRNFLSKHNRVMSVKPAELSKGKENIGVNIPSKDVWYHVNQCLERNGYAKLSISDNTDPRFVCNTVLSILHDYEQRGQKIQQLLIEKQSQENPNKVSNLQEEISKLEDANSKLKEKLKNMEFDLSKSKSSKRKEWGKKQDENNKQESSIIKDLKLKCAMAVNNTKNMEKEAEKLKATISQMIQRDEKIEKRDKKIIDKIFGKQPKGIDTKLMDLIKGYENQKERNIQRIETLEEQIKRLNDVIMRLQNENKCLSKGSAKANSQYYYMNDEGKLLQKLEELEKIKENQLRALHKKEEIIEENLEELENVKEVKEQLLKKVKNLENDLKNSPSVYDLHSLNNTIAKLEKENSCLKQENNNLENELMLLKNNTNSHIRQFSSITESKHSAHKESKNNITFEYDNSSSKILLESILEILNIQNTLGNAKIIETVGKIQKVVMAVPRMESFIKQITAVVFQGQPESPSRIERLLSEIQLMQDKIMINIDPLINMK